MLAFIIPLAASRAEAGPMVVEAFGEDRPDDADAIFAPLVDELAARDYLARDALVEAIESRVSRPGDHASAEHLAEARSHLARADESFVLGEWAAARDSARRGVDLLIRRPGSLAGDEALRREYRHALIMIAESDRRLGDTDAATEAMAEVVRTFPTIDISSARYSPAVTRFFNDVRRDVREQEKGRLEVRIDDASAVVFVNERYAGSGHVTLTLIPGTYRVLTRKGSESGRVHIARVAPGDDVGLSLSWSGDAALETRGGYVALEYASERARAANETRHAVTLARQVDADGVVVIGIRQHQGRRSIVGQVLSLDSGKVKRTGTLAVEPIVPGAKTIRNLGRYLAGEDVEGFAPTVATKEPGARHQGAPLTGDDPSWVRDPLGWSLTGVGIIGAGLGLGLLANASSLESDANAEPYLTRRKQLRNDAHKRRVAGGIVAAVGGVALIAGVVTLAVPSRSPENDMRSTWLRVGPRGIAFEGRF